MPSSPRSSSARWPTRPADEWIELLTAEGVPAGKIRGVLEALEAAGSETTVRVEHPTVGPLDARAHGDARRRRRRASSAPPLLGEHTREVLAEAGLDDAEIDAVVAESRP